MKKFAIKHKVLFIIILLMMLLVLLFFTVLFVLFPYKYNNSVKTAAYKYSINEELIYAVIWTESKFDASAQSGKGALGLMQIMPQTANWLYGESVDPEILKNADLNIDLGCKYLKYLSDKFHDDDLVLAAYNAGEGNVLSWLKAGKDIPFGETSQYIKKVNIVKKIYEIKFALSDIFGR